MTSIKFRALTHNDHKLFFEAISEYGKDFQNIQQYMAQKCGRGNKTSEQNKSLEPQERREQEKKEEDKKREQIRNFYNKLYGKLSQLVGKLDDRVEKVNQELYLLINYGEIWKKHGFKFNNKTKKLLEELVNQGYTTLRFKSKNVRLRTPPCKALKKINEIGIDEKVKVVSSRELPKDVVVEFHPATNRDWLKVQSISQNPLVRARLSIQKRVSNILEFLEGKWNISQDKLNRTVDAWLKVPPNNQPLEDLNHYPLNNTSITTSIDSKSTSIETTTTNKCDGDTLNSQTTTQGEFHLRLRLRPAQQHELKEVNITRVVPDNHLDLSLNAYIKRLSESITKNGCQNSKTTNKDTSSGSINQQRAIQQSDGINAASENLDHSQGALSSSSRFPISLTTPDSSILLERSCTSDQPTIAQARRHLNLLQTLAGSFEGCENSRTACEDTQDRSINSTNQVGNERPSFSRIVSFAETEAALQKNGSIPALFSEDAIETNLVTSVHRGQESSPERLIQPSNCQLNTDSQNSKSVDFHIPNNLSLIDWFKLKGQGGDEANDAFPTVQASDNVENMVKVDNQAAAIESTTEKVETPNPNNPANMLKPQNHMIEIEKLADGWTRQDESSMTIGELYLAFKCPEKIVLEYEFEQFTIKTPQNQIGSTSNATSSTNLITTIPESPSNNTLIFKLLTTASLSLAHIERQKQEQQHKLHDQPGVKLKRRKGPSNPNTFKYLNREDSNALSRASGSSGQRPENNGSNNLLPNLHLHNNNYMSTSIDKNQGQGQMMTLHDIETTNQRVEEALKQLQPTRLSVFRRAR